MATGGGCLAAPFDPSPGVGGVGLLCKWIFAAGSGVCTFVGGPNILVLVPSEAGRRFVGAPYASEWFGSEGGWTPTMST